MVAASAEAITIPFAPPLGMPLLYRTINVRPLRAGGDARVTLDQTLCFTQVGATIHATMTAMSARVDAPDRVRASIALLLDSFNGHRTEAELDSRGGVVRILGGAETWEAIRRSQYAAVALMEANPMVSPAEKERARVLTADSFDLAPEARDARLAESFAPLMSPSLPPLRVGETRRFRTVLSGPSGPLGSTGWVTMLDVTGSVLHVRVETRADPAAVKGASEALLHELSRGARSGAADGATAAARAAETMSYGETLDAFVDRTTGLLVRSHLERRAGDGTGSSIVESSDIVRLGIPAP